MTIRQTIASMTVREQQRQVWNRFSHGWQKWDELVQAFHAPIGAALLKSLRLPPDALLLDVATGTGEPGLTAAAGLTSGQVIGFDLSVQMVTLALENARLRQLDNYDALVCDAGQLPFDDAFFDAVSCRCGYMFFPALAQAAAEQVRVLKSGGRLAAAVWGPPQHNLWATLILSEIGKFLPLPAPKPDAPGLFRCADPAGLKDLLRAAGLKNVVCHAVEVPMCLPSPESYWGYMTEVAAPVVSALSQADPQTKAAIRQAVFETLSAHTYDGEIRLNGSAWIITGQK
ncbi:MAG: class I SAM-dependent methyltransferase [Candidatus Sericytochromatia bacterium]